MKPLLLFLLLFVTYSSFAQEKRFQIEGRVINEPGNPVEDAYVINFRTLDKYVSRENGVFNIWVLPGDSLVISHISYHRKVVKVFDLLLDPHIKLKLDSINIKEVNISPNQKTENQIAKENINAVVLDPRPKPEDEFTESERIDNLIKTENRVERSSASSVSIVKFSPSDQIEKLFKKLKKKDKTQEFNSTKKLK